MAGERSSYVMATEGVNTGNSFLLGVDGEFDVFIEDVTPEEVEQIVQGGGYVDPWTSGDYSGEDQKYVEPKKKITVTVMIDGIEHKETRYTAKGDVEVDDVQVEVSGSDKPEINVTVL